MSGLETQNPIHICSITESVEKELTHLRAGEWQEASAALEQLMPQIALVEGASAEEITQLRELLDECLAEAESQRATAAAAHQGLVRMRQQLKDAVGTSGREDGGHFVDRRL